MQDGDGYELDAGDLFDEQEARDIAEGERREREADPALAQQLDRALAQEYEVDRTENELRMAGLLSATPMKFTITPEDLAEYERQMALRAARREERRQSATTIVGAEPWVHVSLPDPEEKTAGSLETYHIEDMVNLPQPRWLVESWIEEQQTTIVYGGPGTGKTAFLSSLLWAWVSGDEGWFGGKYKFTDEIPAEDRRVLYVLLEGQGNYYERFQSWLNARRLGEGAATNFGVTMGPVQFATTTMVLEELSSWPESLKQLTGTIEAIRPQIVVIDTLSMAIAGFDENSSGMSIVMAALQRLSRESGCAFVLVHHTPKNVSSKHVLPRGSSTILGAAGTTVWFEHGVGAPVYSFQFMKQRNMAEDASKVVFLMESAGRSFYVREPMPDENERMAVLDEQESSGHRMLAQWKKDAMEAGELDLGMFGKVPSYPASIRSVKEAISRDHRAKGTSLFVLDEDAGVVRFMKPGADSPDVL